MDMVAMGHINLARQLSTNGSLSKSFDCYILAFEVCSETKVQHEPEFRVLMNQLVELLTSGNKMEDTIKVLSRALDVYPEKTYYLNELGKYLYKYAFYMEAWSHFQKALKVDPTFVNAEKNMNSVKNLLVERWHFRMLNDKIRNETYREAIHKTLVPVRDSILDLGSGTGLLAMYASECSPMAVTAVDGSEVMTNLAEIITQDNDYDEIIIVNKMSTSMNYRDIGGKRSLVVTEMFDAGLFGEHVLQSLSHAWEYLINPRIGRIIPNKAEFFVIGAKCDHLNLRYQLGLPVKALLNISHLNVHILTYNETYDCEDVHLIKDIKYITEPQSLLKIDFNNITDIQHKLTRKDPYEIELKALEDGEMNVVVGWFNLYLVESISLTTDPRSKKRANAWQQAVFFDNLPKTVKKNDIVDLDFLLNGGKLTLVQEYTGRIHRISPETLRFLNDMDYINLIIGSLGMACVYLGQMAEMSQISVIDLCPFPLFGLQLLKRGAQGLICYARSTADKQFFKKVFKANDVPLTKVTILIGDDWSQDVFKDEKYHAIFCNVFELCGEVDLRFKEMAQHLKQNHLVQGGLFMPANVKIVGQVVNSHWLDINNKVYDDNVSNLTMAKHMNKYQVTQNFCLDLSHIEYTALTEPTVLGSINSASSAETFNVPIIKDGYASGIICWYKIELMEDLHEISTNRSNSFIDGLAFIGSSKIKMVLGHAACVLCSIDHDGSFKLTLTGAT